MAKNSTGKITTIATGFAAEHPVIAAVGGIALFGLGLFAIYELFNKGKTSTLTTQPQQTGGEQSIPTTITPSGSISNPQSIIPSVYQNPETNPSGFGTSAGFVGGNLTNTPQFNYSYSSSSYENISESSYNYEPITTKTNTQSLNYSPSLQYSPQTSLSTSGIASGIGTTNYGQSAGEGFLGGLISGATQNVSALWNDLAKPFSGTMKFFSPQSTTTITPIPNNAPITSSTTTSTQTPIASKTTTTTATNNWLTGLSTIANAFNPLSGATTIFSKII